MISPQLRCSCRPRRRGCGCSRAHRRLSYAWARGEGCRIHATGATAGFSAVSAPASRRCCTVLVP